MSELMQTLFNVVVLFAAAMGGWVLKGVHDALDHLQKVDSELASKVQSIEVLVAGNYVRRDDLDRSIAAIFTKLDRIETKLDTKVDK
jgi:hypothetical protein